MESIITCECCGIGKATHTVEDGEFYPINYYICDTCGSEFADLECMKLNLSYVKEDS